MCNLELVEINNAAYYAIAKSMVMEHHSYVPTFDSVGRRIDWLIKYGDDFIGMIGIGSSTYPPCKDILNFLNISKEEYAQEFNSFANNWKFCLLCNEKNIGTQVLKLLRNIAPIAWHRKYGDELKYLITFVGANHNGAVYKADNWTEIGHTSGLPPHKSVSMKWDSSEGLKEKFVKPNGENEKIIFIKKLKDVKHLLKNERKFKRVEWDI